jgi:superfamily II DNA or RNA helicase
MPEEERKPLIDGFRRGEFAILSNCSMLAEGFDVPATSCCILARPTKSLIRFIQMCGRVLRPHDGKERALILDHAGVVRRLGWPTEEIPYELDDGKPKQEEKKNERLPRVCPSCFAVYKPSLRKCPVCSFEPKPVAKPQEVEDEELVQLSRKARNYSLEDKQAIYSALLSWTRSKGMKDGAAYHKYKNMVGCYPSNQLDKVTGPMIESVKGWIAHENIKWAKSQSNFLKKAA